MTTLLSIGEFATLTQLSVKTLRHYHDTGLLEPEAVDPYSGYRRYSVDQIPTAQVIRRFRDLDMPVRDVARLLAAGPDDRAALIAEHLARLEHRLAATGDAVGALRRLLTPEPPCLRVEHRTQPSRRVTGVTGTVGRDEVLDWYAAAMSEIDTATARAGGRAVGPPGGQYDNALFTDGAGAMTVFVPTDREVHAGRVGPIDLATRELAVTVHRGPHDDIDVTYGTLGAHLARQALCQFPKSAARSHRADCTEASQRLVSRSV